MDIFTTWQYRRIASALELIYCRFLRDCFESHMWKKHLNVKTLCSALKHHFSGQRVRQISFPLALPKILNVVKNANRTFHESTFKITEADRQTSLWDLASKKSLTDIWQIKNANAANCESSVALNWGYLTFPSSSRGLLTRAGAQASSVICTVNLEQTAVSCSHSRSSHLGQRNPQYTKHMAAINSLLLRLSQRSRAAREYQRLIRVLIASVFSEREKKILPQKSLHWWCRDIEIPASWMACDCPLWKVIHYTKTLVLLELVNSEKPFIWTI